MNGVARPELSGLGRKGGEVGLASDGIRQQGSSVGPNPIDWAWRGGGPGRGGSAGSVGNVGSVGGRDVR